MGRRVDTCDLVTYSRAPRGVELDRAKLFAFLKTCKGLKELVLLNIAYRKSESVKMELTIDTIPLPHLKTLVLSVMDQFPCLLLSISDLPEDCSVTIYQTAIGFDVVEAEHWRTEACRRLFPFKISSIFYYDSFIELEETSHPRRPPMKILLLPPNWYWPYIDACLLKGCDTLNVVELGYPPACDSLCSLPPFKTLILHAVTAAEGFALLQERPLQFRELEYLILDNLDLAVDGEVDFEWHRRAATTGHVGIPNAFQMFLGVKLVLDTRRDGGSPIKRLVLRERGLPYDLNVIQELRQRVAEVVVEDGPPRRQVITV